MGLIGKTALAAHSIAIQIASVTFMVPLGFGQAVTVRVGRAFGAGDREAITPRRLDGLRDGRRLHGADREHHALRAAPPDRRVPRSRRAGEPAGRRACRHLPRHRRDLPDSSTARRRSAPACCAACTTRACRCSSPGSAIGGSAFRSASILAFPLKLGGAGIWMGLASGLAVVAVLMTTRWLMRERLGLTASGGTRRNPVTSAAGRHIMRERGLSDAMVGVEESPLRSRPPPASRGFSPAPAPSPRRERLLVVVGIGAVPDRHAARAHRLPRHAADDRLRRRRARLRRSLCAAPACRPKIAGVHARSASRDHRSSRRACRVPLALLLGMSAPNARLFGVLWALKLIRLNPAFALLWRVLRNERQPLLSVTTAFFVVTLFASTIAFVVERNAQPDAFGSVPAALWWAVTTITTTGYGDKIPVYLRRPPSRRRRDGRRHRPLRAVGRHPGERLRGGAAAPGVPGELGPRGAAPALPQSWRRRRLPRSPAC